MRPKKSDESWFDIRYNEHSIWVVVEKYNCTNKDGDYRYAGAPCMNYEEALELMNSHVIFDNKLCLCKMVEDGAYYDEINPETGEVVKQYIVKKIGMM